MKKNILVVDDSALMRRVECDIINSSNNFQATDVCRDGLEAYEKLKTVSYDAVVLDVNMPRMDGLQLLERLQDDNIRAKIIMVSTVTTKDAETTILALERGAIDFVTKPTNVIEAKGEDFKVRLLRSLSAALRVPYAPEPANKRPVAAPIRRTPVATDTASPVRRPRTSGGNKIIALACSTGGPKALQTVIPLLPKNIDAPMVLVQHMPVGFTKSMADRLNDISEIEVREAQQGDVLEKGIVYIAPGGKHMLVKKALNGSHYVELSDMPPIGGLRPCADITFDSLADTGYDEVVCAVLTGMGADGTNGILSLSKKKPVYVISQDEQTCVVYGMPKSIYETGMVDEVVSLKDVAKSITKNVGVS